jgi:hypothetical protein
MKTILAILLGFILSEAPVLAMHGYTLGAAGGVTGSYAGILVPTEDTILATGSNEADFGQNSLGLFILNVPTTGLGSGTVYLFSGGEELTGPIVALPDPTSDTGIVGVISATGLVATEVFQNNVIGSNESFSQVTAQAGGGFYANTSQSNVSDSPDGINLSGTANVTVETSTNGNLIPTDKITFAILGYQQSAQAATSSAGE